MERGKLVPKLSDDISFHKFSDDGYFIHQKELDHRIKITKETYFLLLNIDGKKNLIELQKESNEELPISFLYDLLYKKLGKFGIIKSDFIEIKEKEKPNYLKLSFIVIPPKIISKITPFLKFLFVPKTMLYVLLLSCTLIFFSIIKNYNVLLYQNIENLNWGLFLLLGFISVTFHEFGHVTATEFYGAKHGGIGGGFYLFSPVYFADVTDIWKLKPKQRIIVNLAGIYFELIMCSLYVIIGLVFNVNLLLVLSALIFFKTLLNLNPFLRGDGYWILTDFTGIANLYKTSNNHLITNVKSVIKNKKNNNISRKSLLLSLYASVNYTLLILFVGYVLLYKSQSLLSFPIDFISLFSEILKGTKSLRLIDFSSFIIPLLFYYLVFTLLKNKLTKILRNINHKNK